MRGRKVQALLTPKGFANPQVTSLSYTALCLASARTSRHLPRPQAIAHQSLGPQMEVAGNANSDVYSCWIVPVAEALKTTAGAPPMIA